MLSESPSPLIERTAAGLHQALFPIFSSGVPATARVLDLGAGSGAWVDRLKRAGYCGLIAADLDSGHFAAQASFIHADLNGDFSRLVLPPNGPPSYDAITAIEVIEHLENTAHFLRECATCLVRGGLLYVTSPNVENLPGRLKFLVSGQLRMFDPKGDKTHITPITEFLLRRVASSAGLSLSLRAPLLKLKCSRPAVRLASRILQPLFRGNVDGDCNLFVFTRS
jgi:2-polyprenyl-3-methyl-5-hydroxy-6-metoxy-1,4-benzoquinol methylase